MQQILQSEIARNFSQGSTNRPISTALENGVGVEKVESAIAHFITQMGLNAISY